MRSIQITDYETDSRDTDNEILIHIHIHIVYVYIFNIYICVRWMCGVSLKDRRRSEDLCNLLGINYYYYYYYKLCSQIEVPEHSNCWLVP